MKQIANAADEMNASIIKGFLETHGIHSTFGPMSSGTNSGTSGPNRRQHVYVEEKDAEQALKLLKEQGLIDSV